MKTREFFLLIAIFLFAATVSGQNVDTTQNAKNVSLLIKKQNANNILPENKPEIKTFKGSVYADFYNKKIKIQDIVNQINALLRLDQNHTFEQISQKTDETGFIHTNYQEFYKNCAVDGKIIMFHEKEGFLQSITGNYANIKNVEIKINISDSAAIEIAKENLKVAKLFKENPVQTVFIQNPKSKKYVLAKKVKIESFMPLARYDVFIDAATGEVLNKISLIAHTDVQGTASTFFSGVQSITCDRINSTHYRLKDNARKIGTYNGETWEAEDFPTTNMLYTNSSTTWSNNPALDAHWGMEKTYDYYFNTFNRNSYDDYGSEIYNVYNPVAFGDEYQYNAAAIGYGMMIYGTGGSDYGGYNPFVSIDVAGHEFTHLVTMENGNGGLYYQSEAGALNESFSDIFGVCIDFYANVNPNWLIGEQIQPYNTPMRSMSNPNDRYQPDTYLGNYWADTGNTSEDNDHGGVHTNSGVQNFWFYLLCNGGSGTNDLVNSYSVTGIGMNDAQKIAYRNLINYLTPSATYIDAYNGSLQATASLFGISSAQYTAVQNAWYAVGIDENTVSPEPSSCSGTTYLTSSYGTFNDGSGAENYGDNLYCHWVIQPQGATSVVLSFTEFDIEENYDFVYIYDSYDNFNSYNYLARYSGSSIPATVVSNTGMMIVVFETDEYVNAAGWSAYYLSDETERFCQDVVYLYEPNGTITDGSGNQNYGNNSECFWVIQPWGATSITLTFTAFSTEYDYDFVYIYDNYEDYNIFRYSGHSIPNSVVSNTGVMIIGFFTNESETSAGWSAYYTSNKTGLNEIEDAKCSIFPNPAKDIVNIRFDENQQFAKIELYDMVGKLIKYQTIQSITANSIQEFNTENIPEGIYNLRIISEKNQKNQKLIISR